MIFFVPILYISAKISNREFFKPGVCLPPIWRIQHGRYFVFTGDIHGYIDILIREKSGLDFRAENQRKKNFIQSLA